MIASSMTTEVLLCSVSTTAPWSTLVRTRVETRTGEVEDAVRSLQRGSMGHEVAEHREALRFLWRVELKLPSARWRSGRW